MTAIRLREWLAAIGRQKGGLLHLAKAGVATVKYRLAAARPIAASESTARALSWLCRAQDAAGGAGLSAAFSLVDGWLAVYPETTGYAIPTLLDHADAHPELRLRERALRAGHWLAAIQFPSGALCAKHHHADNRNPSVFNTGMGLHGWVALAQTGDAVARSSAERAAAWLVAEQELDGAWIKSAYNRQPHAYYTMVAWALLRWHQLSGDDRARGAAVRNLEWTLAQQKPNGWFDRVAFSPSEPVTTHVLSYTTQGLVECARLERREEWVQAALRASTPLLRAFDARHYLPATFSDAWSPTADWECAAGSAQTAVVWCGLSELLRDESWRRAAERLVQSTRRLQRECKTIPAVDGALPGSWPIWGDYDPFAFPNHAAKFFLDAIFATSR